MTNIFPKDIKNIHLIGIGGVSMNAIAKLLHKMNYTITGSDTKISKNTQELEELGIKVQYNHEVNLIKNADILIHTAAIKDDNKEFIYAKDNNIEIYYRAEFLGLLTSKYKYSIGVSGTHGKTSTTAMIGTMLLNTDINPTIFVGADVKELNGNFIYGKGDYIVNETCEYKESYLDFNLNYAVLNNLELDHTDYYKNIQQLSDSFLKFSNNLRNPSYLIANIDDKEVKKITEKTNANVISYSIHSNSLYKAENIKYINGFATFDFTKNKKNLKNINLSVPGEINVYNALAALCTMEILGLLNNDTVNALEKFRGSNRRFEFKGEYNSSPLYDDYAHHPSSIKALIDIINKMYPDKKKILAFEPHTYSRTHDLFDEFSKSFKGANKVYITDIFAAREKNIYDISSNDLVNAVNNFSNNAIYIENYEKLIYNLKNELNENTVFFTVGAGMLFKIHDELK